MSAVLYEVSIAIRPDFCDAFEAFMIETHIPEVMATRAFTEARFAMLGPGRYRVSYTCSSREILNKYLLEHSPRLREGVAKQFPDGLTITREEWDLLATF